MFGAEHPTNKFNKSHLLDTNWHDLENMSSQNLCSASPTILNPVAKKVLGDAGRGAGILRKTSGVRKIEDQTPRVSSLVGLNHPTFDI